MKLSTRKGQFISMPPSKSHYMKRFQNGFCKTIASANETQTIVDDLAEFATGIIPLGGFGRGQ
jgi:hypothetical protein